MPDAAPARTFLAWCVGILGAVSLGYSISYLVGHFDELVTAAKIKEFVLPLVLTACFLPFLVAIRYLTVWQTMLHMIRFGLHDNDKLYRFTRRALIRSCGAHLGKAQLFEAEFRGRLWGAMSEHEVSHVMTEFGTVWQSGRRPKVDAEPAEV